MINYVPQEDPFGCGLACLAMVTDQTYKQVEAEVTYNDHGITDMAVQAYLADKGYASAWKHKWTIYTNQPRLEWPPKLWANVHIAMTYSRAGAHFIVVLRDGSVLDPATPQARRFEEYPDVAGIGAVYRRGEQIDIRTSEQVQQDIDDRYFDEEYD